MSFPIQAIIFDKHYWTPKEASRWLHNNKYYPIKKEHETKNYFRYRIHNPKIFKKFITKRLPDHIELILGRQ